MKIKETNKVPARTHTFCDSCGNEIKEDYYQVNKRFYDKNKYAKLADLCNKCFKEAETK